MEKGLANQLSGYQISHGDWRELFRYIDRLDAVTKADILRVAQATFKQSNRTVGKIETESAQAAPSKGAPGAS